MRKEKEKEAGESKVQKATSATGQNVADGGSSVDRPPVWPVLER